MASEKVSRKMVLEIRYVNANNAVIHTENLVTGILAKISLGTGIWAKFRQGTGIWYPPSRPSLEFVCLIFCSILCKHAILKKMAGSHEKPVFV